MSQQKHTTTSTNLAFSYELNLFRGFAFVSVCRISFGAAPFAFFFCFVFVCVWLLLFLSLLLLPLRAAVCSLIVIVAVVVACAEASSLLLPVEVSPLADGWLADWPTDFLCASTGRPLHCTVTAPALAAQPHNTSARLLIAVVRNEQQLAA